MSRNDHELLDRAVDRLRAEAPDSETVRAAADRVWQRLSAEAGSAAPRAADVDTITGCADFQALIPAYLAAELPEPRRLLLEDHSRECVPCRRALLAARSGGVEAPAPRRAAAPSARRWLPLAAAALLAVGVAGWFATDGLFAGQVAVVADVDGLLLGLDGEAAGGVTPLVDGQALRSGEAVRTGKGSTAVVRLDDGSLVELAERTQISVRERRRGTTIEVERGAIIVEAADQRDEHLFVATGDSLVSVTGTIFAVQHGLRGSRVSVVEGEVHVTSGGREVVLHPGQQTTSRPGLARVPVASEVAWSRNVDHYLALLGELSELEREIARRVAPAPTRYDSQLIGAVPAQTFAYVALPNLTTSLVESWQVFQERLTASPALAEWWSQRVASGDAAEMERALARLRDLGSELGDEVVVALPGSASGEPDGIVVLAEVARPDTFIALLEREAAELAGDGGGQGLVVVRDLSALDGSETGLLVWVDDGMMVAADGAARLAAVAAARAAGGGFAATPLGQAVERAYADGTQWLLAVDLGSVMAAEAAGDEELARTGFGDVERLLVERWDEGERAVMSAELTFGQTRHGIASWLAAPAPMGALDFVSADAHLAAAFVVKEPASMVDDLLALTGASGDADDLGELEHELGLSLRQDVAAPLGGEVAFAMDGPFLPEPSWKLIVEVYDPSRLQHTLEVAVARLNDHLREEGEAEATLEEQSGGGRTYYHLSTGRGIGVSWVYADGYLVAGTSRALLERTLDQREAGTTLTGTARFRSLLPRDARTDFSALFYQNVGPLLSPLAGGLSSLGGAQLSAEQRAALDELIRDAEPTVAYAYGESDRILFAGTGPGGPFGLGFQALSGFGGLALFGQVLDEAAASQAVVE